MSNEVNIKVITNQSKMEFMNVVELDYKSELKKFKLTVITCIQNTAIERTDITIPLIDAKDNIFSREVELLIYQIAKNTNSLSGYTFDFINHKIINETIK